MDHGLPNIKSGIVRCLRQMCIDPALAIAPADTGLDLALRPSPMLRRVALMLWAFLVIHMVELLLLAQWRGAAVAGAVLGWSAWMWRRHQTRRRWRRLLLGSDGRVHLIDFGGGVHLATLALGSVRLGRGWLLDLRVDASRHYLVVWPDAVEAAALAELHRRLGAAGMSSRLRNGPV